MDDIDGTGHYERASDVPPPSLLTIVLDTNPYAWSTLAPSLPLSKVVADLLVFINAHLAFNHSNRVAVIASHCGRTAWLYPSPKSLDGPASRNDGTHALDSPSVAPSDPNKYRPFSLIEHELLHNLQLLFSTTKAADLAASATNTMLSGALTLALSYINKTLTGLSSHGTAPAVNLHTETLGLSSGGTQQESSKLTSRILVVSASGDLAGQYIPIMNLIFAAQHSRIPIDVLKIAGDTVLLQQASYTTSGIFLSPEMPPGSNSLQPAPSEGTANTDRPARPDDPQKAKPISILPTLLFAFLPDSTARKNLIPPTGVNVDFRAACFCHRRVVDIGFVCSVCLSIFCEEGVVLGIQASASTDGGTEEAQRETSESSALSRMRDTGACLTCGTILSLRALNGEGGPGGLLLDQQPKGKRKKKKRREDSTANA